MISIRKFLDAHKPTGPAPPGITEHDDLVGELGALSVAVGTEPVRPDMFALYGDLLDHLAACILSGDSSTDLRSKLQQARGQLVPDIPDSEARRVDGTIRALLTRHSARVQENTQRSALELQHIVGVLNQALSVVAGGGERVVSRLQKIQGALQRASGMQDMAGLRASLSDAVHMVEEEARKEQETAARDLATFGTEVARVRGLVQGNATSGLPGRPAGIDAINEALAGGAGEGILVAAFVFAQLQMIVQRYGPDVVDDLFFQLIRERIQPLVPSSIAFRWTPFSLVALVRGGADIEKIKESMLAANRAPLVHKVSLGNRTAVLKVGLSHLLLDDHGRPPAAMVTELDAFTSATTNAT